MYGVCDGTRTHLLRPTSSAVGCATQFCPSSGAVSGGAPPLALSGLRGFSLVLMTLLRAGTLATWAAVAPSVFQALVTHCRILWSLFE